MYIDCRHMEPIREGLLIFYDIIRVVYLGDTIFGDNLCGRDSLSTMDKRPVPNVSVIRRFHSSQSVLPLVSFLFLSFLIFLLIIY